MRTTNKAELSAWGFEYNNTAEIQQNNLCVRKERKLYVM